MASEQELYAAHRAWLGNLTDEHIGLVITVPALLAAQAFLDRSVLPELQQRFLTLIPALSGVPARKLQRAARDEGEIAVDEPLDVLTSLCGWPIERLAGAPGGPPLPDLAVRLPDFGDDRLEPTQVLLGEDGAPLILVRIEDDDPDLDRPLPEAKGRWSTSPQARFERLLRERDLPIGLLLTRKAVRLIYVPRLETAGHLTFPVSLMAETAGREVLGGLVLLLRDTLFTGPTEARLPAILKASRRYQNEVSTELAEQVMSALGDLLAGFQSARALSGDTLLAIELAEDTAHVYGGLLATLMRLVFLLYAEDRGLLPDDPIFADGYSLAGLYERLRDDDARFHETMDQRYGAWAQLLSLFSIIHFGAKHRGLSVPMRLGELFNPDEYPFLEGRPYGSRRAVDDRLGEVPRVSDGVVFRVLHQLLYLEQRGKGVRERISYRALDVEQIGSVYEALMGYTLESAAGPSLCLKPHHVVVDLAALLARKGEDRLKALAEVDVKPSGAAGAEVKKAATVDTLAAALTRSVSPRRPGLLPPGTLYLQPTEERRRSGSHYTPRELTRPIVDKTLAPLLSRLRDREGGVRASDLLALKVCDPAMGSGAFLVEVCRQLAAAVAEAWKRRPEDKPSIPPDETDELYAMRLVAQRCVYGVDKNPFAVALAKLSLWLVTLAKDHPFTFVDHALREGDSLVGLGREQIASFHWAPGKQAPLLRKVVDQAIKDAEKARKHIHDLADSDDTEEKLRLLGEADSALAGVRRAGDLVLECYFAETKDKARLKRLGDYAKNLGADLGKREPDLGAIRAFHWEIEFPEVFSRENPGFDAFVGNPPFLGGTRISVANGISYRDWLAEKHESSSLTDLVAYFFRRSFELLRRGGSMGLVATNSIAQGDTRTTGLAWICSHGGSIYDATRRTRWPGQAAVIVSIVHIAKSTAVCGVACQLDGRPVEQVSAYLFHAGSNENPVALMANRGVSVIGSFVLGIGFVFEDDNPAATPLGRMDALLNADPRNKERICAYVGGEDLNTSPTQSSERFIIDFGELKEPEARQWAELMQIVESKVKPARQSVAQRDRRELWWLHATRSPEQKRYVAEHGRCLALSQVSSHFALAFVRRGVTFSHTVVLILLDKDSAFATLQSRPHELWARFFASTLEERLRYTPTDCFETFPFPPSWEQDPTLEAAGKAYYDFRAALMISNNQGLTATYNRFHDPDEQDLHILELRRLHDAMDRAVLDAYGWTDLRPTCTFLLDYEDEEDADTPGKARRKKPWRYRWPDEVRDEVLARLLQLNQERAAEERGKVGKR